jgi:hypothetical protein
MPETPFGVTLLPSPLKTKVVAEAGATRSAAAAKVAVKDLIMDKPPRLQNEYKILVQMECFKTAGKSTQLLSIS